MADDIDIEEHDLLQNPTIKSIFPDISALKKELDCFSEGLSSCIKEEPNNISVQKDSLEQNAFENIESISLTHNDANEKETLSKIYDNKQKKNPNKIILGSKPPKNNIVSIDNNEINKIPYPKLIIEDIGIDLHKSTQFCRSCNILFPQEKTYQNHFNNVHQTHTNVFTCDVCGYVFYDISNLKSHLKRKHSTEDQDIIKDKRFKNVPKKEFINVESENGLKQKNACFHCDLVFTTQKLLVDHLYDVLDSKRKPLQINENIIDKSNKDNEICQLQPETDSSVNCTNTKTKHGENTVKKSTINKCDICKTSYSSSGNLSRHMKNIHGTKNMHRLRQSSIKDQQSRAVQPSVKDLKRPIKKQCLLEEKPLKIEKNKSKHKTTQIELLRCPLCSYFFKTKDYFKLHMTEKHQMKNVPPPSAVKFDSKCVYCQKEQSTPKLYNVHVWTYHKDEVNKKGDLADSRKTRQFKKISDFKSKPCLSEDNTNITNNMLENIPILKSTLFMCSNCDIHFLNAQLTLNHKDHIEMLINWKCPECLRIFKTEDRIGHKRQHELTKKFTVHKLSSSKTSLNEILFCCSKCTVHFNHENWFIHLGQCENETPESYYCNICDILIDLNLKSSHELCHTLKQLDVNDFIIVEADFLETKKVFNPTKTEVKIKCHKNDSYVFCETCRCFIGFHLMHAGLHLEGKCSHLPRTLCRYCGIVLTPSGIKSHRSQHGRIKELSLQDLYFYDLKSGEMVCPQLPKFPECDGCHVNFINRVDLKNHECQNVQSIICEVCNNKFSGEVFDLHMAYHTYSLKSNKKVKNSNRLNEEKILNVPSSNRAIISYYTCQNCLCTVDSYDKVVEHCQTHIERNENFFITKKCEDCNLIFQQPCYDNHLKNHAEKTISKIKNFNFDSIYFLSARHQWLTHIYGTLSEKEVSTIIKDSIYKIEKRAKMKIIQEGLQDLTVYQCEQCGYYTVSDSIFVHLKTTCSRPKKFPCYVCGFIFVSVYSRREHEKVHKDPKTDSKNYRIVGFKRIDNKTVYEDNVTNQFVIYQCRNCHCAIDRCQTKNHVCNTNILTKCDYCGLIISNGDINHHVTKHKTIESYTQDNIKIVLFGDKQDLDIPPKITPSFCGIICDYKLYQCIKCKICIKTLHFVSKHTCCQIDSCKTLCKKCNLDFCTSNFKTHNLFHANDPDYLRENMKILSFDLSLTDGNEHEINSLETNIIKAKKTEVKNTQDDEETIEKKNVTLYKCSCGLHFLNEPSITNHVEECGSKKINKQKCNKCELLFTPNILFNHLLAHHGNKKYKFMFDVIEMSKTV